ncbi:MAG: hypothetical protein ABFD50_15410 [Smithella sp.]
MNGWEIAIIVLMMVEIAINIDKEGESKGVFDPFKCLFGNLIWFIMLSQAGLFFHR